MQMRAAELTIVVVDESQLREANKEMVVLVGLVVFVSERESS